MDPPVVIAALRSPFGFAHGQHSERHPVDLLAPVLRAAVGDLPVDAVVVGCASPVGAQGDNIARASWLAAGLAEGVGATTIAAHGSSSMVAILHATALVRSGAADLVVAGGIESMSVVPMGASAMARHAYGKPWGDAVARRYGRAGGLLPEGVRIEGLGVSRARQDDWARLSIGRFRAGAGEIVTVGAAAADEVRDSDDDSASYPPIFDIDGSVTAYNSAPIGDGAAVVVVAAGGRRFAPPLARVIGGGSVGRSPVEAASPMASALARALGTRPPGTLDVIEIHEGFAAAALATIDALGLAPERANARGGALAIGHPLGASGARLAVSALDQLVERGAGFAAAVIDGEDGAAAVLFER